VACIKSTHTSTAFVPPTLLSEAVLAIRPGGRGLPKLVPGLPKRRGSSPWSPRTPLLLIYPKFAWPLTGLPKWKYLEPPLLTFRIYSHVWQDLHKRTSGDDWSRFSAIPVAQPTLSKYWWKLKKLASMRPVSWSYLSWPPSDSRGKACLSFTPAHSVFHWFSWMLNSYNITVLFCSLAVLCWPHHGRTFSIYLCPLSFWLTLPRGVLSTYWCCPSRPCVVFLSCVHLTLFLAVSLSPVNSLVSSWCDHNMQATSLYFIVIIVIYFLSNILSKK